MKSTRILYVAQNYQPMSASSITTHGILKKLAEKGHEIQLLVPERCPRECVPNCSLRCKDDAKIVVTRIPTVFPYYLINSNKNIRALMLAFSQLFLILKALKIGKTKKFDFVISQHHSSHLASLSAFILSKILKLPLIVKTHDVYDLASGFFDAVYLRLLDNVYRTVLRRADYILVVSDSFRSRVIETHKLDKDKVLVFPTGVDVKKFKPNIVAGFLRRSLGVEGKKVILFIGEVTEARGLALLVKVLPKITSRDTNIVVLVVGRGPQKAEVERLAKDLGVRRFVRFIEPVAHGEIPKYVCLADVAVGPLVATIETFGSVPRKVLEYMACAKPVVACYGGVSEDLISDGYNGFLVHDGKVEELATVILEMLSNSDRVREVGLNARRHVEEFYDWDKVINGFDKILRERATLRKTLSVNRKPD